MSADEIRARLDAEIAEPRTPIPTCGCSHRWGNYGRLHGISMGAGWIRTGTAPECTEHSA